MNVYGAVVMAAALEPRSHPWRRINDQIEKARRFDWGSAAPRRRSGITGFGAWTTVASRSRVQRWHG